MPTVTFFTLTQVGSAPPNIISYHEFLLDETSHDFCVVELHEEWLNLEEGSRLATFDAVVLQLVQSELSRAKAQTTMIPFNPVFGPNRFPIQENMVFTLMPFEAELTEIYNTIVKPTVEGKGLVCRRADDINSNNVIMSDVWKSICESRFIIADLTGKNANVMCNELGIAHTVGKETILIHQSIGTGRFPFDISHFRIIDYQNTATGGTTLTTRLGSTIDSVLQKIRSAGIMHSLSKF